MESLLDSLCPDCFQPGVKNGVCEKCGCHVSALQQALILPPRTVLCNRYILGILLGRGGFGATYKAYDLELQKICAIKEYLPRFVEVERLGDGKIRLPNLSDQSVYEREKKRFIKEAELQRRISWYPHIVPILHSFAENNTYYYVMEFIDGKNLKQQVEETGTRFSVPKAVDLMIQLGTTLQEIYDREGLIHMDISPENIMVDRRGNYILIDFGNAKNTRVKQQVQIVGKRGYAPPEQYSDTMSQGSFTDTFSLASTFYFLVSGKTPSNAMERMKGKAVCRPLNQVVNSVPQFVSDAVEHAMELDYKKRTQSIRDFLFELRPPVRHGAGNEVGVIRVVSGGQAGQKWIVRDDGCTYYVGRDETECSIVLHYEWISRRHFSIRFDSVGGIFRCEELSQNGTYMDGKYLNRQEFWATAGCTLQFPETDCVLRLEVENEE